MGLTHKWLNYFKPFDGGVKLEKMMNEYSIKKSSYSLKNVNLCNQGYSPQIAQINVKKSMLYYIP